MIPGREDHVSYQVGGATIMQAVKDALLEMARGLPPEATWDDVMERVYVRQKIEDGMRDADEGKTTPHDEVFQEFADDADSLD